MTDEEQAQAFVKQLDLGMVVSSLERAKALADSCKEYVVAERIDVILADLYDRRQALRSIIIG